MSSPPFSANILTLPTSQGLCSSVATTFNTPLLLGGPSSVRQQTQTQALLCLHRSTFYRSLGAGSSEQPCASLWAGLPLHLALPNSLRHGIGSSIAEIVSAFPTCGGLCVFLAHVRTLRQLIRPWPCNRYTASAQLVPKKHRPIVSASHACLKEASA